MTAGPEKEEIGTSVWEQEYRSLDMQVFCGRIIEKRMRLLKDENDIWRFGTNVHCR